MESKTNMIPEEKLEQVSGGVSTGGLKQVKEWGSCCESYECKLCGMHGRYIADHKAGCAVGGIQNPGGGLGLDKIAQEFNGCWSCKYVIQGSNYPAKSGDLYCNLG